MRKLFWFTALLALLAAAPAEAWDIPKYDTQMQIRPDSSVTVTETITADFTGDPHHGIYRDIPLSGRDRYGNRIRIRFDQLKVTDENGSALAYVKLNQPGGRIRIRIGSPNVQVEGRRTYVIRYRLLRAVHFFDQHDELYWNVVGPEWEVPIRYASCVVTFPKDAADIKDIRTKSFTGYYGSTSTEALSDVPNKHGARFWVSRILSPGEMMTIVVGWPKGLVQQPSAMQEIAWFVSDNGYFFFPPVFLLFLFVLWVNVGRDPNTGRSEMVTYEPPDGMRPAEVGTLIDESADVRDIAATIIDLAVRGYIHITAVAEKSFLSTKTDHQLDLKKPYDEAVRDPKLTDFEQEILSAVFATGESVWASGLANHFYVHIPLLKNQLYDSLMKRGYFTHRPDSVRSDYIGAGLVMVVLGILGAFFTFSGGIPLIIAPGWFAAFAVCGGFLTGASKLMPRKTVKGKDALIGIKGFEEYLTRAEKRDIEFQEKHDLFEKFLPYALALGIADKWARAFEGLGLQPPDWYTSDGGVFYPTLFAHDLGIATTNWGSSMTSQPRTSGGGGSGFFGGGSGFGGGFSGGGGGGGGGGGW